MKTNLSRIKKKNIIKLFTILFALCAVTGLQLFNLGQNISINSPTNDLTAPTFDLAPSAYEASRSGNGSDISVSFHQSYYNTSFNYYLGNLDTANTFNVPCPDDTDTSFNSSSTNIKVDEIYAPNKTLIVEDNYTGLKFFEINNNYLSFNVSGAGNIANISLRLAQVNQGELSNLSIVLCRSTATGTPGSSIASIVSNEQIANTTSFYWHKIENINYAFDPSVDTNNNMYFLRITYVLGLGLYSDFAYDTNSPDNLDESFVYNNGGTVLTYFGTMDQTIDFPLIIDFYPENNTPAPESINMQINENPVLNGTSNDGLLTLTDQEYAETDGDITFSMTADWWDVSCNVTEVQVNYTKTGLMLDSAFSIPSSGSDVMWNLTQTGGYDFFDSWLGDQYINVSIPDSWHETSFQAFNGTGDEKTVYTGGPVINNYRDIKVTQGGNGVDWYFTVNSTNVIGFIGARVSGVLVPETLNFTNDVDFYAVTPNSTIGISTSGNPLNISVFSPTQVLNFTAVNTTASLNAVITLPTSWNTDESANNPYGIYTVQASWNNGTEAGFLEKQYTLMGLTELTAPSHADLEDEKFKTDLPFNVTFFYNDTGKNAGISTVNATYTNNSVVYDLSANTFGAEGNYYLTLDPADFNYGPNYITINFNKTNYYAQSLVFNLKIVNTTEIKQWTPSSFSMLNYENKTCSFQYNDTVNNVSITDGSVDFQASHAGFENYTVNLGNGTYTIYIYVNNVPVSVDPYAITITVSKDGYYSQNVTLSITVANISTAIDDGGHSRKFDAYNFETISYSFWYNDTNNTVSIGANTAISYDVGGLEFVYALDNQTDGYYTVNFTIDGVPASTINYTLRITISRDFYVSQEITLSVRVNLIDINCTKIGNQTVPIYKRYLGTPYSYLFFVNYTGTDTVAVNLTTSDVQVTYDGGTSWPAGDITLTRIGNTFELNLSIDNVVSRNYYLIVNFSKAGIYGWTTTYLNFTLIGNTTTISDADLTLRIGSAVLLPMGGRYNATEDDATLLFSLRIYDEDRGAYLTAYLTEDPNINITVTYNDGQGILVSHIYWGNPIDGNVEIDGLPGQGNYTITLTITATNFESISKTFLIEILPGQGGGTDGIPIETIIFWVILIALAVGSVALIVGIQKGVVAPKKRAKARTLAEVQSVFDDAVNIEHVLVLYKASGMCVYFKSLGLESIDPELISGFLSAVSSFGREMESQQALNEINYGDKKILLSDGDFIRVALVLSKEPSVITRQHLTEFIAKFERSYAKVLPNWRGNLKSFDGAGKIVDDVLNTSIILPHELSFDNKAIKSISRPISKDVMKIARSLLKDTDRKYFFIAQLLTLSQKQLNTEKAKVFMGIKELRDLNVLKPIDIAALEAQPISQQEMNLISQKVSQLQNVAPELKQKLVEDIASMKNPVEREAFLASLADHKEIVSMPIGGVSSVKISDAKGAKKEISNLRKKARSYKSKKDYKNSLLVLNNAATIATSWELQKEFELVKDEMRVVQMEDQEAKMKMYELKAKSAVKAAKYGDAAQFYELASRAASEVFKLGRTDFTNEVKRLTNKQREYEKLAQ